jgi:2-oxoglutarate/2-oxoacid ferredoxin oxidoreductase subunit beta
MTTDPWAEALEHIADENVLLMIGPGAPDSLPPGIERRHVPPGTLIAVAEGARLAAPHRPILAAGGDCDLYGAQLGDLLHAIRRNTGIACLVADNGMAESDHTSASDGPAAYPLEPLSMALAAGGTFIAQGLGDQHLAHLAEMALHHPGFALVNVWQQPYDLTTLHSLDGEPDYDPFDRSAAMEWAVDPDRVSTGIFYREPERPALEALVLPNGGLAGTPGHTAAWEYALYLDREEEA